MTLLAGRNARLYAAGFAGQGNNLVFEPTRSRKRDRVESSEAREARLRRIARGRMMALRAVGRTRPPSSTRYLDSREAEGPSPAAGGADLAPGRRPRSDQIDGAIRSPALAPAVANFNFDFAKPDSIHR